MAAVVPPFPYPGGKRSVASEVWARFGAVRHYIEPFCGSMAMLLAAPRVAEMEVVSDLNGFIANFWRALQHTPQDVAAWADYPVSHIDISARHRWLMDSRPALLSNLMDADWPGDAKAAGWWLYGHAFWIGSGWCDWHRERPLPSGLRQIPDLNHAIIGVFDYSAAAQGADSSKATLGKLHALAARIKKVRVLHGEWFRCLNHYYGGAETAVFLDPPYIGYEELYGSGASVAHDVAKWAVDHQHLRIALCGHVGDYDLPGWDAWRWKRPGPSFGGSVKTISSECIWFSPACLPPISADLFAAPTV